MMFLGCILLWFWVTHILSRGGTVRAAANESQKNTKQETKRFSTFAVYRLSHSETKKKHCLIRESCLNGTCVKQPINDISEVTWLCTWFPK